MILDDSVNILQTGVPSTINSKMFNGGPKDSSGRSIVTYEMDFSGAGWLYLLLDSCIVQNEAFSPINMQVATKYEQLRNEVFVK